MANKTLPTPADAHGYLAAIDDPVRRADCQALAALMERITGAPPVMWGASIVGCGSYHYRYASGREGDAPLAGFAPRKGDISIYLSCDLEARADLLAQLGRHKIGKACLYVRRLDEIDMAVLEQLVRESVAATEALYGTS
ncbi:MULTISPECIES: DUF1801 domain-containing protein [unclassified Massilia]|uniref:DUF1801 domain-containing protein n=1 Tax=unclassified Massilia TaxID=2609279 RepID=UPI00177F7A6A|nr:MULTISPECIES: DUF1801 domain-containing protein [unclassified Massilia]MBD8530758.1 DUF1801 domain-containing protein [Massilia sp. CFBP 13647]MBD8674457.1 DUF1801 domain-containing protein [Massilia sp. CFBP 13721]